jgi:hypothetical protein
MRPSLVESDLLWSRLERLGMFSCPEVAVLVLHARILHPGALPADATDNSLLGIPRA